MRCYECLYQRFQALIFMNGKKNSTREQFFFQRTGEKRIYLGESFVVTPGGPV